MPPEKYTYLLLNLASVFFPFILSFDNKVAFYKQWKYLFPAAIITAFFFLVWDYFFTISGVWQFNERYILGIKILSLPIEEWLFFFTVPYACVFIYEVLPKYFKSPFSHKLAKIFFQILGISLFICGAVFIGRVYTSTVFIFTALFILLCLAWLKIPHLGYFLLAYLVQIIPFLIVNGILTSLPVVIYNNQENLGLRIYTIPAEDTIYSLLLLLMNVAFFEFLRKDKKAIN
ncbi:MAG: lycopene cyclase domain-containing protein [Sphingobacteriales bacterium]|nr:MAG: lycopene cyclase domain-containing protein [Sphingobacteriales bacterium]